MGAFLYEIKPQLYMGLSVMSVTQYEISKIAIWSGLLLAVASWVIFDARRRYRSQHDLTKFQKEVLADLFE